MKITKVFYALSSLDTYELNTLKKYIHSPYFNVNPGITNHFDHLYEKLKQGQDLEAIPTDVYWKMAFPSKAYDNQKYLKLNSDLLDLVENFLAQIEFDKAKSIKTNLKLKGVSQKGLDKLYPSIIGELDRLNKLENTQSADFYYHQFQIENSKLILISDKERKKVISSVDTAQNFTNASRHLDIYYIIEKIKLYSTVLSWKNQYDMTVIIDYIQNLLIETKRKEFENIPAIQVYSQIVDIYNNRDSDLSYQKLRELMKNHIHLFPKGEVIEIYATATHFCISKVNRGDLNYERDVFELYKERLHQGIFLIEGKMPITMFRNIVFTALREGDVKWTENFIEDYAKFLDPKQKDSSVLFAYARLDFYKKDYGKVLQHLSKLSFDDVWYNVGARTLQIACYYELDEFDALESVLQAFKMYLRREKTLAQNRKQEFLGLIKFATDLIKINPKNKKALEKLRSDIENTKGLASKPWLLEKVDQLLGVTKLEGIR